MTPRERLFSVLNGEVPDRPPAWLLFPFHPTGYYVDVRSHPAYRRVHDHAMARGIVVLNRRHLHAPLHTPEVVERTERGEGPDGPVTRRVLAFGGAEVFEETSAAGTRTKPLLASDADLETFLGFPLETDSRAICTALDAQLAGYRREAGAFPLAHGAMMLDLGSPVNALYHRAALDAFALWSLTHGEAVAAWLDRRLVALETVYRYALERDLADVYFLVGSELAAPPLVGPDTFRRWVVPQEGRLIRMVQGYGKRVIQHFHGQIRDRLSDFAAMAPDGLHTIEAPPVGNCTLTEAFEATGGRMTLIGNIQYDVFRSATPEAMRRAVAETLAEAAGRRFMLSPTAGPFDPRPSPRLIENYLAFIDAATGG